MNPSISISRRAFLAKAGTGAAALAACSRSSVLGAAPAVLQASIVVFTKVYQELALGFEDAAALTAEAGLQGIDPPVRPGGEIPPERVAQELPRYAQALRQRGLQLPLLTTAITSVSSPHAELILRTAKNLGVQFYRIGFIERVTGAGASNQLREVKAQFKDLAGMNAEIGIGAMFQNHSPSGHAYVGGDLGEMREILSGFNPGEIGMAFDIGHALIVHREKWRAYFEALKSHLKVAYVKDVNDRGQWVPFGQGEIARTDYFKQLKALGYHAPLCLHIEYDWSNHGEAKNRATLARALSESAAVIRRWASVA